MLDFTLPEGQRTSRTSARLAQKEIRSIVWDYVRDATWPQEIIEKALELGLMNSQLARPAAARAHRVRSC